MWSSSFSDNISISLLAWLSGFVELAAPKAGGGVGANHNRR